VIVFKSYYLKYHIKNNKTNELVKYMMQVDKFNGDDDGRCKLIAWKDLSLKFVKWKVGQTSYIYYKHCSLLIIADNEWILYLWLIAFVFKR